MKRSHLLSFLAVCLVFAAGTVTGRFVQLGYDKPAMTSEADLNTLRIVDGCTFTRTIGGDGSFLNFVCRDRPKTGVMR